MYYKKRYILTIISVLYTVIVSCNLNFYFTFHESSCRSFFSFQLFFIISRYKSDTFSLSPPTIINPNHIEPFQNDILFTPRAYHPKQLYEWVPAPIVPEIPGLPGEMGKYILIILMIHDRLITVRMF